MRISQALLDKTAATAANLQTMIDETTVKYKEYPALGGFLGTYSAWTVCALLFSIIGAQNPRSALAVFFVGSSKSLDCSCVSLLNLISSPHGCYENILLERHNDKFIFIFLFQLDICIYFSIYGFTTFFRQLYDDQKNVVSWVISHRGLLLHGVLTLHGLERDDIDRVIV